MKLSGYIVAVLCLVVASVLVTALYITYHDFEKDVNVGHVPFIASDHVVCVEATNRRRASLFMRNALPTNISFVVNSECTDTSVATIYLMSRDDFVDAALLKPLNVLKYWKNWYPGLQLREPDIVRMHNKLNIFLGGDLCFPAINSPSSSSTSTANPVHETAMTVVDGAHVYYFPLGPRNEFTKVTSAEALSPTREYAFNFVGSLDTDDGRLLLATILKGLESTTYMNLPIFVSVADQWMATPMNDGKGHLNPDQYRDIILTSFFTLCPGGDAFETFRFWEAVEAGSVPVITDPSIFDTRWFGNICPSTFAQVMATDPPVLRLNSWQELDDVMSTLTITQVTRMREDLAKWREYYWKGIAMQLETLLGYKNE